MTDRNRSVVGVEVVKKRWRSSLERSWTGLASRQRWFPPPGAWVRRWVKRWTAGGLSCHILVSQIRGGELEAKQICVRGGDITTAYDQMEIWKWNRKHITEWAQNTQGLSERKVHRSVHFHFNRSISTAGLLQLERQVYDSSSTGDRLHYTHWFHQAVAATRWCKQHDEVSSVARGHERDRH